MHRHRWCGSFWRAQARWPCADLSGEGPRNRLRGQNLFPYGRMGAYQYLNMDQVVGQALSTFARINPTLAPTAFARAAE